MSVINQMLKDLQGRQNPRLPAAGPVIVGGSRGDRPARYKRLPWVAGQIVLLTGLLVLAGVLWYQPGAGALTDDNKGAAVDAVVSKRAPPAGAPAGNPGDAGKTETTEPAPVAIDFAGIQSGSGSWRLVFEADRPFAERIEQRFGDDGAMEYRFPNTRLSAEAPLLARDNPYLHSYSIGRDSGATVVRLRPRSATVVYAETGGRIDGGRYRFSIQARRDEPAKPATAGASKPSGAATASAGPATPPAARADDGAAAEPQQASGSEGDGQPAMRIQRHGADAERHYRQALDDLRADRLDPAIGRLREAVRLKPGLHEARELLATLLLRMGHKAEAFRELQQGIERAPGHTAFARLYAQTLVDMGQLEDAARVLERSAGYAGDDADYQGFMAALAQRLSRHEQAVQHYMSALELKPRHGAWWLGMAISLEALDRREQAKSAYQRALDSGQLNPELARYTQTRIERLGG